MVAPGRSRLTTTRAGPSVGAADGPGEPLAREPGVVAVSAEMRPVARVGAGSVMDAPEADRGGWCGRHGAAVAMRTMWCGWRSGPTGGPVDEDPAGPPAPCAPPGEIGRAACRGGG